MLACALSLAAQQSNESSTTQLDINGNQVADGPQISRTKSASGSVTIETRRSINGQSVPVEQVEERVLRDDASGKAPSGPSGGSTRRVTRCPPSKRPSSSRSGRTAVQRRNPLGTAA